LPVDRFCLKKQALPRHPEDAKRPRDLPIYDFEPTPAVFGIDRAIHDRSPRFFGRTAPSE
jgi:hypothetical protein